MTTIPDGPYIYRETPASEGVICEVRGRFVYRAGDDQALVVSRLPGKWVRLVEAAEPVECEPIAIPGISE